jgi:hypothetical protein
VDHLRLHLVHTHRVYAVLLRLVKLDIGKLVGSLALWQVLDLVDVPAVAAIKGKDLH